MNYTTSIVCGSVGRAGTSQPSEARSTLAETGQTLKKPLFRALLSQLHPGRSGSLCSRRPNRAGSRSTPDKATGPSAWRLNMQSVYPWRLKQHGVGGAAP